MNARHLTPQEQTYVRELCLRQLHIQAQIDALMHRPMVERHEATGMPVIVILTLLMESAGWVNLDLEAVLS